MKPRVYLAGGMSGLTPQGALAWRDRAAFALNDRGIETLSPMRGHPAEVQNSELPIQPFDDVAVAGGPEGVILRDLTDVRRADALLVSVLGNERISVGTAMELAWAYLLHIPAVVAIEKTGNPHDDHPMVRAAMRYRADARSALAGTGFNVPAVRRASGASHWACHGGRFGAPTGHA